MAKRWAGAKGGQATDLAAQRIADAVVGAVQKVRDRPGAASSSTALALHGGLQLAREDQQFQAALDSIDRAAVSAKQAQRLLTSAANAFGDEADKLEECARVIRRRCA